MHTTSFTRLTAKHLSDDAVAAAFVRAVHRQVVANGGTKFDVTQPTHAARCIENFSLLIDHQFVDAYALQTVESPVATLVLYKHAYAPNGYAGRVEDIVTQESLEGRAYGKTALRCAFYVAQQHGAACMTLECESSKPYGNPVYQAVGFGLTILQPARFTHDPLQSLITEGFCSNEIFTGAKLVVESLNQKTEMHFIQGNPAQFLKDISATLPPSCHIEIQKDGAILASADKEDRFSIIRASTFDFSKPSQAGENESPIGSQMDNFTCALESDADVLDCFRALSFVIAAPQTSRTDQNHLQLQQSFMDVSVDIADPQHKLIVEHYGLEINSYATAEELANDNASCAQIYWLTDAGTLKTEAAKVQSGDQCVNFG